MEINFLKQLSLKESTPNQIISIVFENEVISENKIIEKLLERGLTINQPETNRALKKLSENGILEKVKIKTCVYYSVCFDKVNRIEKLLKEIEKL